MKEMELICKCGNDKFHVSEDGKIGMCSECGVVYDNQGNEKPILDSFKGSQTVKFDKITIGEYKK